MNALKQYNKYQRLSTIAKNTKAIKCYRKWLSKAFVIWAENFCNDFDFFGDSRDVLSNKNSKSECIEVKTVTGDYYRDYDHTQARVEIGNSILSVKSHNTDCDTTITKSNVKILSDSNNNKLILSVDEKAIQPGKVLLFTVTDLSGNKFGIYLRTSKTAKKYRVRPIASCTTAYYIRGNFDLIQHTDCVVTFYPDGFEYNGFRFTEITSDSN